MVKGPYGWQKSAFGSTSLVMREIQIKTMMRYYFTATGMTLIRKIDRTSGEDMEKPEPSYIAYEDVKWYHHLRKQFGSF